MTPNEKYIEGRFDASKVITNYNEDLKKAKSYAAELEAKLAELLAAVEQAIETHKQPHYGDTDTELDNAYDAINLLCEAVTKLKGDKP